MALTDDGGDDKEWLYSLLLDVQLEHFHTRIIDELQVRFKILTIFFCKSFKREFYYYNVLIYLFLLLDN